MSNATELSPSAIDFTTLKDAIASGREKVSSSSVCSVDLSQLQNCNTAAVCFLLALRRQSLKSSCQLNFVNINQQLRNLLNLYQLSPWFEDVKSK